MQKFNIELTRPGAPRVLYASQGDSLSRFFSVTVTDNGAAYTPPDGAIYTVRFGAPGMPAGWYDTITEVGGGTHPAVVADKNTYTVEIAEQALGTPGQNALVLIVSDATGYTLASWAFVLQVAAVPGYDAPEATVYYNALSEQVAQVLANAQAVAASAVLAESWAVGGTGTRPGENTNNAAYWASEAQRVSQGALGWYETEQALQAAHPTGTDGQWAIIGSTDTIWTWDSDTSAWVNSGAQVDLSNYYTKAQADAAFATAAQGTLAASAVQSVNGLPGPNPSLTAVNVGAAPAENGVNVYIHSRTGTVNNFVGTGANGRAKMTADVQAGDTFTVNGAPVTAYMGADSAVDAMAGSPWNGKWVSFIYDGETLNFKGGSGKGVNCGCASANLNINQSSYTSFIVESSLEAETENGFSPEYFEPQYSAVWQAFAFKCLKSGDYAVSVITMPRNGTTGTAYSQVEINGVPAFNNEGSKLVPNYSSNKLGMRFATSVIRLKANDILQLSGKGTENIYSEVVSCCVIKV